MNQPRDHFLAHTRLAGDEHFRIRASSAIDVGLDRANGIAAPDEADFVLSSCNGQPSVLSVKGPYLDRPTFFRETRYYWENHDIVNHESCNFDVSISTVNKLRIRPLCKFLRRRLPKDFLSVLKSLLGERLSSQKVGLGTNFRGSAPRSSVLRDGV